MASVPTRHDRAPRSGLDPAGRGMPGVGRRRGNAARRGESDPPHFPLSCFDTLCLDNPADAASDPSHGELGSTCRRLSRPRRRDPPPARWPMARRGSRCQARHAEASRGRTRCAGAGPERRDAEAMNRASRPEKSVEPSRKFSQTTGILLPRSRNARGARRVHRGSGSGPPKECHPPLNFDGRAC